LAELGLGGRSDTDVGLWGRLVIATLVLDEPIVLRGRVLEHPEGIAGRADSRLRLALPAQVPVLFGRLVDATRPSASGVFGSNSVAPEVLNRGSPETSTNDTPSGLLSPRPRLGRQSAHLLVI
jgi:hypothetical protein